MTQTTRFVFVTLAAAALAAAAPASLRAQVIPAPTKAEVARLVAVLRSDAAQHEKAEACRQLGVIGTAEVVPVLAAFLSDERLAHMARYALEPIPDPAVDRALHDALARLKGRQLVGAIASLGVRRDPDSVAPLAALLRDPGADVAQAAARALGSIGTGEAATALQSAISTAAPANRLAVFEGMLRCAEALAARGAKPEAASLYDRLRSVEAPHQVIAGAWRGAILNRPWVEGVRLLRERLAHPDWMTFATAVRISHEMPGPEVTAALRAGLAGGAGVDRQVLILQTLGARADKTALDDVERVAREGVGQARIAAVGALGQLGASSAASLLFELAAGDDAPLAAAARAVLLGMGTPEIDAAIRQRLEKGDIKMRRLAIELVGERRLAGAGAVLRRMADDPDAALRRAAIQALTDAGTGDDVAEMTALLLTRKDPAELVAVEAGLGAVCGRAKDKASCADVLLGALAGAEIAPRCALLRALRGAGGAKALDAVRAALRGADPTVREAAFRSLCEWPGIEAAADLLAMAKETADAKRAILALRGYINLIKAEGLALDRRLAMCRQAGALAQRIEEVRLLLGALGAVPSPDALALALPHLARKETRNEAAEAALAIGTQIVDRAPGIVLRAMEAVSGAVDNKAILRRVGPLLESARAKAPAPGRAP